MSRLLFSIWSNYYEYLYIRASAIFVCFRSLEGNDGDTFEILLKTHFHERKRFMMLSILHSDTFFHVGSTHLCNSVQNRLLYIFFVFHLFLFYYL